MEQTFESLTSLITFVFNQLETPLLTVDDIFDYLHKNNFQVQIEKNGIVSSSALSKRAITNELQRGDSFVCSMTSKVSTHRPKLNTDSPKNQVVTQPQQLWAIRPNNPLFQCDAAIAASIDQLLTERGPLTVGELVHLTEEMGADEALFHRVLGVHADEFTLNQDGRIWYTNQPMPVRCDFENIEEALKFAFTIFTEGATIEELQHFLCLATQKGIPITRLTISHAFYLMQGVFVQIQHRRYAPIDSEIVRQRARQEAEQQQQQQMTRVSISGISQFNIPGMSAFTGFHGTNPVNQRLRSASLPQPLRLFDTEEEKAFDANEFFGGGFSFSPE